jgi:hypothetical protein
MHSFGIRFNVSGGFGFGFGALGSLFGGFRIFFTHFSASIQPSPRGGGCWFTHSLASFGHFNLT